MESGKLELAKYTAAHISATVRLATGLRMELERRKAEPGPLGELARRLRVIPTEMELLIWDPRTTHPTAIFIFDHFNKANQQSLFGRGAKIIVCLQLAWTDKHWLGDPKDMGHVADKSSSSVWTGRAKQPRAIVQREPLSTPGGQISLWYSDFVEDESVLPKEFIRPRIG